MVIRIPIKWIAMILGLMCCSIPFIESRIIDMSETAFYDSPLNILIIDPGHGGLDGGAVTADGVKESELNLSISLKLNTICHLYGIPTVMTRTDETIDYPETAKTIADSKKADQQMRLNLIRDYPHGIMFSIHQNYYPSTQPSGIQVFYGHNQKSRELGILLQENLRSILCPTSRRVAAEVAEDIYLFKYCDCISVLIECGFLSNPREAQMLGNDVYQTKIAAILTSGYLNYITQTQK